TKSNSGPITEVTDELSGRSCDPPHPYTKNAPTAQKFSDQRCKRTFATVSVIHVISSERKRLPLVPRFRTYRCVAETDEKGQRETSKVHRRRVSIGSFQRIAVPLRQIGCGRVGLLQKAEQ